MTKRQKAAHPELATRRSAPNPNSMPQPRFAGPPSKAQPRLNGIVANIKKLEQGLGMLAIQKPPAGTSRKVRTTHHLPAHKMYDPELGMWTFPYRQVARFTAKPSGATFDAITSTELLISFTPSNGNQSPLQLCKDGNETSIDVVNGWATPSLWTTIDFLPNLASVTEQHRIVNASLKVTYTGTSFANSGVVYVYQGPHIPQFHKVAGTAAKLSVAQMIARIKTNPRTKPYDVESFRNGKIFHIDRGTQRRVFRTPYEAYFPDSSYGNKIFQLPTAATSDGGNWSLNDPSNGTTTTAAGTTETTTDPTWTGAAGFPSNASSSTYYVHTHNVQVGGSSAVAFGDIVTGVPPTMQALYFFAEGMATAGSNFLVEAVQQAEIQIDPDASAHIGLATPPNDHSPEPDAGSGTLHLAPGSKTGDVR